MHSVPSKFDVLIIVVIIGEAMWLGLFLFFSHLQYLFVLLDDLSVFDPTTYPNLVPLKYVIIFLIGLFSFLTLNLWKRVDFEVFYNEENINY